MAIAVTQSIWDKYSGEIDSIVAAYWHENCDLSYIIQKGIGHACPPGGIDTACWRYSA